MLILSDLRIESYHDSNRKGQHVYGGASPVRITHLPTNIVVEASGGVSHKQNRDRALELLTEKLGENHA